MPKTKQIFQLSNGITLCTLRYPHYWEVQKVESTPIYKGKRKKIPKQVSQECTLGDPISAFEGLLLIDEINKQYSTNLQMVSIENSSLAIKEQSEFLPHIFPINSMIIYDYPKLESIIQIQYEMRSASFAVEKIINLGVIFNGHNSKGILVSAITPADLLNAKNQNGYLFNFSNSPEYADRIKYFDDFSKISSELNGKLEIIQQTSFLGLLTRHSGIEDWENKIGAHISPLSKSLGLVVEVPDSDIEKVRSNLI